MKRTILPLIALVFASLNAFSQAPPPDGGTDANGADKNFHFGLNFTPGIYFAGTNAPAAGNGAAFGYGYGVNLEFYFTQNYGFCTGIEIATLGSNWTNTTQWTPKNGSSADSLTAHQYSLEYLEIPLEFKFRTLPIGLLRYFGIVGFDPGIRISSSDNYSVTGSAENPAGNSYQANYSESNVSLSGHTSIVRMAYVIGGGVEYNIAGTTSIQGALAYDSGFLNTNTDSKGAFSGSVLTRGVTLTIGILF